MDRSASAEVVDFVANPPQLRPPLRVTPQSPPAPRDKKKEELPFLRPRANLRFSWLRESAFSVHPAPVPLFVHFADFCEFGVGDGGGYYMDSIQPILSFSCFRGIFREFRVMMFKSEESRTRNRSTSKNPYGYPDSFHHLKKSGPCTPA